MEMKLFVKDWLYRHSPAFRPNDHEFLEKLEEYRKELFKKTVEAARAGPRKQETTDKSTSTTKKLFEEPNLNSTTFDFKTLFKRNEEKAKGDKYIPVVVTELVKAEQKKKVSFSEKIEPHKGDSVQNIDEVLPNEEDVDEVVEITEPNVVEEKKEEVKEEKKKKVKKESFIWFSHVRRLRSILKLLFEHQSDGLSEFTKFLKRHRITNYVNKRSKDETAEKYIVEHLLSLESDLQRLLEMSKHLMYSRKQKNLKIRRRIVELSDSVLANLESCLKRKASGVWLDPKNLFFKLQRIEMLYTHLYNDESVAILTNSPRVTIRRKMFKHKIENEGKLTSPVKSRNLLQCNSDLIDVVLPEVPGKCSSLPALVESFSLSNVRYKETSERLMIEIESLIFKKLSLLNEIDKRLEKRKVSSDLDLSLDDEKDVKSIIGTCDSVDFTKDKRLGLKIEDVTKPDFNERLLKVEDSLIVTSKRLEMPLKYHDLHPRVKTPYDSTIDLPVQLSRTCARFDFFESDNEESLPPPPKTEHKKETKKIPKKKPKSVLIRWIP